MKDYIVPFNYLPLFFNPLLKAGITVTFSINAPMINDITLCDLSLTANGPQVHGITTEKTYKKRADTVASKTRKSYLLDEIPYYKHFLDAFFCSAILNPDGLDVILRFVKDAAEQSVVKGGDVFYFAFDTNVLRDKIYTLYLRPYSDAPNIDFILSETVRSELTNRDSKLRKSNINELARMMGPAAYNFSNQNTLADRLRYIGFLEYNRLRHETDCDQLEPAESYAASKDEAIIREYADFASGGQHRKVLLVSRDNEFIRMSSSLPDIIPIILESRFPDKIPRTLPCSYIQLYAFIYYLSVVFGRVDLVVKNHKLYECSGVWPQKNVKQWERDYMKISANTDLPYLSTIDNQINVLAKVKFEM